MFTRSVVAATMFAAALFGTTVASGDQAVKPVPHNLIVRHHSPCSTHPLRAYQKFVKHHLRHGKFRHGERHSIVVLDGCLNRSQRRSAHRWFAAYWDRQYQASLPMARAAASWFNDFTGDGGGPPACGFHSSVGFANRTLPCGARVRFCYRSRCVVGIKQDVGPAAGTGRDFDLTPGLKSRLGFGDTGTLRYRVVR